MGWVINIAARQMHLYKKLWAYEAVGTRHVESLPDPAIAADG